MFFSFRHQNRRNLSLILIFRHYFDMYIVIAVLLLTFRYFHSLSFSKKQQKQKTIHQNRILKPVSYRRAFHSFMSMPDVYTIFQINHVNDVPYNSREERRELNIIFNNRHFI